MKMSLLEIYRLAMAQLVSEIRTAKLINEAIPNSTCVNEQLENLHLKISELAKLIQLEELTESVNE